MAFNGLGHFPVDRIQLHRPDHAVLLQDKELAKRTEKVTREAVIPPKVFFCHVHVGCMRHEYTCVFSYLCRNPYQQQPLLLLVSSVVDDLTTRQTGVPVEYFGRLGIPLHAPVIDSQIRHQGNSVYRYPLPEHDVLRHGVSLHLTFHLNVEDLQCLGS